MAFLAVTSISVIGLYIAYTIPVYLRWRQGENFVPGSWTLGSKYKWINPIAVVWVALCVIIFSLPFSPEGVPWESGFSWNAVNYAPLVTIGVMAAVTIWYFVSAKKHLQGSDPHDRRARHRTGAAGDRRGTVGQGGWRAAELLTDRRARTG